MTKAKILIVEDDRIVAEDIKMSLEKLGFHAAGIVPSGEEALQIIEKENPDLVLMDIMLKGEMNGTQTAEKVRTDFNIPVVYVTAYADDEVLTRAKLTEPFGYIVKPFEDMELNSAIELALYKHEMETKLKESEAWLSTTLNSIGDAVIATDARGIIKFMNPISQELTGWKSEEAIGKHLETIFTIVNEITGETLENPAEKVIHENKIAVLANNTLLIAKDGKKLPIDDSGAPIRDKEGNVTGVVIVFRDISERKKAEQERQRLQKELEQSQKMESIGTLAGGIAHDFNNMLGIILGNAELALSKLSEWHPAMENLEAIKIASFRATDIIQQLLSFSRKTDQNRQPANIGGIITECLKFLRSSIPTSIEMKTSIPQDIGAVMAVPTQIHQVLINLCNNAVHAIEDAGGYITIKLSSVEINEDEAKMFSLSSGKFAKITIKDNGRGIEKSHIDKIFDPYFTTKEVGKGSGIGLSVVHGIIKNHDGSITVESEYGKGTTFTILLPLATELAEKKEEKLHPSRQHKEKGKERILFVDDEPLITDMTGQLLEFMGYEVNAQTNSETALALFCENPDSFDIVISDVTMPKITGDKLAEEMKKIRPDIPIILCTGFNEKINDKQAEEIGVQALIMKPIVKSKLEETIRNILDNKK